MPLAVTDLLTGLALVLVIEGLLYAAFPDQMKRLVVAVLELPASTLRMAGVAALATGVGLIWVLRQ